jgi:ribokinase
MAKILVIGSSNTDMVVKASRFPQPGETIMGDSFFMFPGGKGANQAVAAARMGGTVSFVCRVGDDLFGHQAVAGFQQENIDTRFCVHDALHASGVALITVNTKGENEIVVAPGANAALSQQDIDAANTAMSAADIVLLQLESPLDTIEYAVRQATVLGKNIMLNPAPAQALPDSLLAQLYLITPNETEAALLTGIRCDTDANMERAAKALLAKGVKHVLITMGARGAYFQNAERQYWTAAPEVQAIDSTGAGDIFNGTLAVALAENMEWEQAIVLACKAAALSVTRMGAQASAPYRGEIIQ